MKNLFKKVWKLLDKMIGINLNIEKASTKKWMVTVEYKVLGVTVMSETMPLTDFIK